jgi:hypothetical protein
MILANYAGAVNSAIPLEKLEPVGNPRQGE